MLLRNTWVQRAPHLFFCNSINGRNTIWRDIEGVDMTREGLCLKVTDREEWKRLTA